MVNDKAKGVISSSSLSSEHNDAANISQSKVTASVSTTMNVQKTGVASQSNDKEENAVKEATNEENAIGVMNNGKIAIEEENNEETAMEEEHGEASMDEDEENGGDSLGDDDDDDEDNDGDDDDEEEDDNEEEEEKGAKEEDEAREEVEEDEDEEKVENKEKANQQAKNKEKVGANSNDQVKKSRKRGRKKVAQGVTERVTSELEDKPGSSSRKKKSKRVESMGMIFMCSSKTKKDCFRYKVLGLPEGKKDAVQKIYKGMRLFLFDFDLRLMYGIYKAAGPGGYNIEPKAFKSAFPSQVRFTILDDCLPLAEEKFRTAIKENYYTRNKFDCQLNSKQVKNLCKLFVAASKSSKSEKPSRKSRVETPRFVDRDRIRRPDKEKRPALRGDRDRIRRPDKEKRARRYRDRPVMYERERFASLPRLPPLPPPRAPAPLYASPYGRAHLEADPYSRDPSFEHRNYRVLDSDVRYRDEIGRRGDPYISYREPSLYSDHHAYRVGPLPQEYDHPVGLQVEYPPLADPRYERRYAAPAPATAPAEYDRPHRPFYRY